MRALSILLYFNLRKRVLVKPSNKVFCVERMWNAQSEHGYGKYIEDEFQKVVDRILQQSFSATSSDNAAITKFYSLWNVRYHWANIPTEDETVKGVKSLAFPLVIDDEELLEKAHINCLTNDLKFSSRHVRAMQMQMNLLAVAKAMVDVK